MPLYRVERAVGEQSQAEIEAGIFRAASCSNRFEGLRWLRSFHDAAAKQFTCYYEARSPADIRAHAAHAGIPCDEIAEVREYLPDNYR